MDKEVIKKIKKLKEEIKKLPKGYISSKHIGGNIYYYHQWSEQGKKQSRYLSDEELENLTILINYRNKIQTELKHLKTGSALTYLLMHVDTKVVELYFDEAGYLKGVGKILNKEHLPLGCLTKNNKVDVSSLYEWWNDRAIPLTRSGIKNILEKINVSSTKQLLFKCLGLSLSDCYWIKPINELISFDDVNFFENYFSEDIGEVLLNGKVKNEDINLSSPDNTSVGNLKKRWKISCGKRVLIKGGSLPFRQEPFNEVICYKIAKILNIPCVPYSINFIEDYPYSECPDFVDIYQDLIPAYQLSKVLTKNNSDSKYTHLIKCAKKLGINDFEDYLNKLIVFDFIIGNEDRHLFNFGILKDAKSLAVLGCAPLFDNGASLGFNKIAVDIEPFKGIETKPFKEDILEAINLVTSFSWIDLEALNNIKENIESMLTEFECKYLNIERIKAISDAVKQRIDYLIQISNRQK